MQDLTFIHLGNQDELAPGIVNFRKRWQQFNILDTMRRFKQRFVTIYYTIITVFIAYNIIYTFIQRQIAESFEGMLIFDGR